MSDNPWPEAWFAVNSAIPLDPDRSHQSVTVTQTREYGNQQWTAEAFYRRLSPGFPGYEPEWRYQIDRATGETGPKALLNLAQTIRDEVAIAYQLIADAAREAAQR